MERFVRGDIVVISFPFSDLSMIKKRPALVLFKPIGEDILLCEITTRMHEDSYDIRLTKNDFKEGTLKFDSFIRLTKIFTGVISQINYKIGSLKEEKIKEVIEKLCSMLKS